MKIETATLEQQELHSLMGNAIAPLPIALISTIGEDGIYNAAPFSLVMPVSWNPPIVCASFGMRQGEKKDTLRNIEFSRDFVVNIMDETLIEPTIQAKADYPSNVDEIKEVGFTAVAADRVKSPLIAEAQVSLECKLVRSMAFGEGKGLRGIVFGETVVAHIKDELWVDGKIEPSRLRAIGRLAEGIYCHTGDIFEMKGPG
jgi:flavin reductase (DIM6/NTAB) family NADH-FMN oxidoreductase RutF